MSEVGKIWRPTARAEIGGIVRAASQAGTKLVVRGSGSMTPDASCDVLSMMKLNKVVEHAVADMTVVVEAGISLEALQKSLAWHNQWLPVDPPGANGRAPGARTLGGLIATNSLGPLRFGYGDWRLLLLGLRWVNGTGEEIRGGGRTVKFSAGYHTARLMIGSSGGLGVITEVTLRTFARPADEQAVLIFCRSAEVAETVVGEVLASPTTPAYVQVAGRATFAANALGMPAGMMVVVVGFLGRPAVCADQVEVVRGLKTVSKCETIAQTSAQSGRLRLWMTSEPPGGDGGWGFRIHTLSSHAARLVEAVERLAEGLGGKAWVIAEAGTAVVRGTMTALPPDALATLRDTVGDTGELVTTFGMKRPAWAGLPTTLQGATDPQGVFFAG